MSMISILADILASLLPAAIVSEKYSIYFYVIMGLDVLVLTCISISYLLKNKGKVKIELFLDGKKWISGLFWTAGAVIWALNKEWTGVIMWMIFAILLFVTGHKKGNQTHSN